MSSFPPAYMPLLHEGKNFPFHQARLELKERISLTIYKDRRQCHPLGPLKDSDLSFLIRKESFSCYTHFHSKQRGQKFISLLILMLWLFAIVAHSPSCFIKGFIPFFRNPHLKKQFNRIFLDVKCKYFLIFLNNLRKHSAFYAFSSFLLKQHCNSNLDFDCPTPTPSPSILVVIKGVFIVIYATK